MDRIRTEATYFEWLCSKCGLEGDYKELLYHLHTTAFRFTIPLDDNRAEDGIALRYRFGHEYRFSPAMVSSMLDTRQCSVLEMMVALAIRLEMDIMSDRDVGDRTGEWFKTMLKNLHLLCMDDRRYDPNYVDRRLDIFMNREFAPDGDGSLFKLKRPRRDMRHVEIWYAAMWYLDEL